MVALACTAARTPGFSLSENLASEQILETGTSCPASLFTPRADPTSDPGSAFPWKTAVTDSGSAEYCTSSLTLKARIAEHSSAGPSSWLMFCRKHLKKCSQWTGHGKRCTAPTTRHTGRPTGHGPGPWHSDKGAERVAARALPRNDPQLTCQVNPQVHGADVVSCVPSSIASYGGGAPVTTGGRSCVAIALGRRFGIGMLTVSMSTRRAFQLHDRIFL